MWAGIKFFDVHIETILNGFEMIFNIKSKVHTKTNNLQASQLSKVLWYIRDEVKSYKNHDEHFFTWGESLSVS